MEKMVKISWYCRLAVGEPKWHGTEYYEPDECENEFEEVVDADELEYGCYSTICPKCGGELTQEFDEPTIEVYSDTDS